MRRLILVVLTFLLAATLAIVGGAFVLVDRAGDPGTSDADGDGLWDSVERDGWTTVAGASHVTDPRVADTDDDGLADGEEAGALVSTTAARQSFVGHSDPTSADTDGDDLGDADEYFLGTDAYRKDTDDDGLADRSEVAFGSDPTTTTPDGDSYSDLEEYEDELDPFAYDLSLGERSSALKAGLTYGDWLWGAENIGGMNEQQLQSLPYLIGHLGSGALVYGDVRDLISGLADGDFSEAALAAGAMVPAVGDAVSITKRILKFAAQGQAARRAAFRYLAMTGLKSSVLTGARAALAGGSNELPIAMTGGAQDIAVYVGLGPDSSFRYVGLTRDLYAVQEGLGDGLNVRELDAAGEPVTLGEARAIGEALVVRGDGALLNTEHLVDPKVDHYDQAVAWGDRWLREHCVTWPSPLPCSGSLF